MPEYRLTVTRNPDAELNSLDLELWNNFYLDLGILLGQSWDPKTPPYHLHSFRREISPSLELTMKLDDAKVERIKSLIEFIKQQNVELFERYSISFIAL